VFFFFSFYSLSDASWGEPCETLLCTIAILDLAKDYLFVNLYGSKGIENRNCISLFASTPFPVQVRPATGANPRTVQLTERFLGQRQEDLLCHDKVHIDGLAIEEFRVQLLWPQIDFVRSIRRYGPQEGEIYDFIQIQNEILQASAASNLQRSLQMTPQLDAICLGDEFQVNLDGPCQGDLTGVFCYGSQPSVSLVKMNHPT
jgi:hypothetical protein